MATYFEQRPAYSMRDGLVFGADEQGKTDFNMREATPEAPIPASLRSSILYAEFDEHARILEFGITHQTLERAVGNLRKRRVDPNFYSAFGESVKPITEHIVKHYGERWKRHLRFEPPAAFEN